LFSESECVYARAVDCGSKNLELVECRSNVGLFFFIFRPVSVNCDRVRFVFKVAFADVSKQLKDT